MKDPMRTFYKIALTAVPLTIAVALLAVAFLNDRAVSAAREAQTLEIGYADGCEDRCGKHFVADYASRTCTCLVEVEKSR